METTLKIGEGLTFEKVWAAIQATNDEIRETGRNLKESLKETRQIIEETGRQMKETDRQMKETDRRIGALTNRFGEMVEYMVIPNLLAKFRELGFTFTKAYPDAKIADPEHDIFMEVDAFLENGDKVMIVEIKSKPNTDDINDHIERMEKLRAYADLHNDKRKYLGAVAGVVFGDSEKTYALKKGFYIIEPSGDTFTIIEPKGSYHPHEW
ncbi:MAG: hypothetical protein LBC31_05645 [Treponema sp.]|jgi:hypothetical protein|nr:hypothetical protein [Treponema sp.]